MNKGSATPVPRTARFSRGPPKNFGLATALKYNVFTEEGKIALRANDNKRIQPIDSIETYAFEARKYL